PRDDLRQRDVCVTGVARWPGDVSEYERGRRGRTPLHGIADEREHTALAVQPPRRSDNGRSRVDVAQTFGSDGRRWARRTPDRDVPAGTRGRSPRHDDVNDLIVDDGGLDAMEAARVDIVDGGVWAGP